MANKLPRHAQHLIMYFLKSVEQGLDVKFTGGIYRGCLQHRRLWRLWKRQMALAQLSRSNHTAHGHSPLQQSGT